MHKSSKTIYKVWIKLNKLSSLNLFKTGPVKIIPIYCISCKNKCIEEIAITAPKQCGDWSCHDLFDHDSIWKAK